MTSKSRKSIVQLLKYAVVGVINTAVTFIAIYVCKALIGLDPYVSNAIGYALGIINSFLWNRSWVFASGGRIAREATLFFIGVGLCYCLQLLCLYILESHTTLGHAQWQPLGITVSGYAIATLFASVVYTAANFIYNKLIAFR